MHHTNAGPLGYCFGHSSTRGYHEEEDMPFAHLTIATRDVPATAAFFARTMRWKPIAVPGNTPLEAAWLEVGPGQQIHVLKVDDFEPSAFEREFGRHFAFFHPQDDFPSLRTRL